MRGFKLVKVIFRPSLSTQKLYVITQRLSPTWRFVPDKVPCLLQFQPPVLLFKKITDSNFPGLLPSSDTPWVGGLTTFFVQLKKSLKKLVSLHISLKYTPLPTRPIYFFNWTAWKLSNSREQLVISLAFRNAVEMLASLSLSLKRSHT